MNTRRNSRRFRGAGYGILAMFGALIMVLPGRSLAAGQPLFEISGPFADSTFWGGHSDTVIESIAQKYIPTTQQVVCSVGHKLASFGSNPGSANLYLYAGGNTPDKGTLMATSSIPASSIPPSTLTYSTFTFGACVTLIPGQTYWFRWWNSGPLFSGFVSAYRQSDEYPNTSLWRFHPFTIPPYGWNEYPTQEWSFRLDGPEELSPTVTNLAQFAADGVTPIPENGTTTKGAVVFSAQVSSPLGKHVRFEVEAREFFLNLANATSSLVDSGTTATTSVSHFPDGSYAWQARAVDEDGASSPWQSFGTPETLDFNIRREPVIIVPGIMGTRLNRVMGGEEVWPNISDLVASSSDNFLDQLKLDDFGHELFGQAMIPESVIDKETIVIAGPISIEKTFYGNLLSEFLNDGYASGTSLFTVPYDWRLDLSSEISRLDAKIHQAIAQSPSGKVNIVTHSMGGILTKKYLEEFSSTDFIDKLVVLAPPQLGAPMAFRALTYGDDMGMKFLGFGLNQNKVKEITQNMPGVYELLPSRRYINVNGGYVEDFRSGGLKSALTYDQTDQLMTENPADTRNSFLLNLTDQFHVNLDDTSFNASSVYAILGCRNPATIGQFRIYDNKLDISPTNGDGTVPLTSALNLMQNATTFFVRFDKTGIDHQGLAQDPRTVGIVRQILEGDVVLTPPGIPKELSDCTINDPGIENTTISVSTHSPVALHVYDSQNHHTGPLENGDIELGIPGSTFYRIGENSFVFVPAGDVYRFLADGLDKGAFDMKVKSYQGSDLVHSTVYLNVPLAGAESNAELHVSDPETPGNLQLDADGNGVFETSIPPTANLDATSSVDVAPPVISIMSPTNTNYTRPTMIPLTVNVTDDNSGIAFIETKLDDSVTTSTVIDSFYLPLGAPSIAVHAVDNAGNPANATTSFQLITTPQSTILDIERSYSLGWITKRMVRDILIAEVRAMIRFGNRVDKFLGKLLLKELAFWHQRGVINEKGYNLLKEDVEWLITN